MGSHIHNAIETGNVKPIKFKYLISMAKNVFKLKKGKNIHLNTRFTEKRLAVDPKFVYTPT